ncbi:MAG TPA: ABC-2 family transporter protein [Chthonomonadaceae bacterium]|nr:ABC-2 family transporter protein [Chthonomonadaceae bacterium]
MEARGFGGTILRIFRLWRLYAMLDVMVATRSLKECVLWMISDAILNIAAVTGMLLLAVRFAGIGHWTKNQVIYMLGYATVVSGTVAVFFSYNVVFISRRLGRGQFDHTLIQPQPIWMSLLTEGFSPVFGLPMLLPGVGLLLWAISRLPLVLTPVWLALLLLNLAASCAIVMAFQYLWGSLAFWAPRAAEEINSSSMHFMDQLKQYPLDGLGTALSSGLLTILPVGFAGWYPCRALLGLDTTAWGVWMTPLAALALCALAGMIFQRGMRHYGRTGSQRYSSFGHRG